MVVGVLVERATVLWCVVAPPLEVVAPVGVGAQRDEVLVQELDCLVGAPPLEVVAPLEVGAPLEAGVQREEGLV